MLAFDDRKCFQKKKEGKNDFDSWLNLKLLSPPIFRKCNNIQKMIFKKKVQMVYEFSSKYSV